jgi:hypothetical protein
MDRQAPDTITLRAQTPRHLAQALHHLRQASDALAMALATQAPTAEAQAPEHRWLTGSIDQLGSMIEQLHRISRHASRE